VSARLPRIDRLDAADVSVAGSPSRSERSGPERAGRRTLLLAVWALLLAAVFAVALRSSAEDGSTAGTARVSAQRAAADR
jgi:hypothetical protein